MPSLVHAGGAIEEDDSRVGPPAGGQSQPAAGQWPAHGKDKGRDGKGADQENEPLPKAGVAPRHTVGGEEKHHGRPVGRLVAALVDQVDENREADQRQRGKHEGLEKAHLTPLARVRPTRNRMSTFS